MAALSDNIGLLFKIKAENQSHREFEQVKGDLGGLQTAAAGAGSGLAAFINPATLAVAAVTALATAAVAVTAAMYRLTVSSAEFAGKVFDIKEKTGLSAAALSTLKVNADNAGSSLETVGNGAARFAKTLDAAKSGNDKALQTMKDLGVTTYDLEDALAQSIKTIYDATEGTEQLALAQKAFGKGGGDLIGTIKQMGGDLKAATREAERLGTVMSDKDLEAADALGDSLGLLAAQARVAGVAFTSSLMPILTRYFTMASQWYAQNQAEVRQWGATIAYVVESFGRGMVATFKFIQQNALILRTVLAGLTFGISEMVIKATQLIGRYIDAKRIQAGGLNKGEGSGAKGGVEGEGQVLSLPEISGGGGGGKGGGGRGGGGAAGPSPYDIARKNVQNEIGLIRQAVSEAISENERLFAEGTRVEADYLENKYQYALYETQEEIKLTENLLSVARLSAEDRAEIERNLSELRSKLREKENQEATAKAKREAEALDQAAGNIAALEKLQYDAAQKEKKLAEEAAKRDQDISERKQKAFLKQQEERQQRLRALREEEESRSLAGMLKSSSGGLFGNIKDIFDDKGNVISKGLGVMGSAIQSLKTIGLDAFQSLAQGFGQLVSNWVLYGETGAGGLKKLTATILSQVAATATTYAIMCLAAAALASTVFGGALMGGTPAQFLQAAALFGAVAIGAGITGRAIAGDSFSQSTSGGGASPQGNGQSQNNNFQSGQFGGFGQRLNNTLAAVEETTNRLANKIESFRPGDVLGMGVEQNPNAVSDGLISGLQNNSRLTGMLKRATGDAR